MRVPACGAVLALAVMGCSAGGDVAPEDLQGNWRRYAETGEVRDQFSFRGDGTFLYDEFKEDPSEEDHLSGTYSVEEGLLILDSQGTQRASSYYLGDAELVVEAFLPFGEPLDGAGQWRQTVLRELVPGTSVREETVLVLDADSTAHLTTKHGDEVVADYSGSWSQPAPTSYRVLFSVSGVDVSMNLAVVEGFALGGIVYQRTDESSS